MENHTKEKVEYDNGNIYYYNHKGQWHRDSGPAMEHANGDKIWYINGRKHRLDGPAIEYGNMDRTWYILGNYYPKTKHNRLALFITLEPKFINSQVSF